MKKFILAAIVAVSAMTANAQVWMGGALQFQSDSNDNTTKTTFNIAPEVGYNLSENWAVALSLGYTSAKNEVEVNNATVSTTNSAFTINPYARYTFAKCGMASFFVDGGVKYTTYNNDRGNSFSVNVEPGIAVAVSEKVSLVAKTGLLGYKMNSKEQGDNNVFNLGVNGNALTFGLYYAF